MWSCLNQIHDPRADSSPGGKAAAAQCQGKVPKGKAVCRVIPDGTSQLAGGSCQLLFGKQEDREQLSEGNAEGMGARGRKQLPSSSLFSSAAAVSVSQIVHSVRESPGMLSGKSPVWEGEEKPSRARL